MACMFLNVMYYILSTSDLKLSIDPNRLMCVVQRRYAATSSMCGVQCSGHCQCGPGCLRHARHSAHHKLRLSASDTTGNIRNLVETHTVKGTAAELSCVDTSEQEVQRF